MIEIHTLSTTDGFDDLISLSRQFFQEYEAHHKEFFMLDDLKDEHVIRYFSSFCGFPSRKAFVAREAGRMIGYITAYFKDQADYWQVKQIGEISGLMVQKEYRHQGVAKKLLEHTREFFISRGIKYFTVYTAINNQGAIDFYELNGLAPLYITMLGEI